MTAIPGAAAPVTRGGDTQRRRRIGEKWYTPYLFVLPHLLVFIGLIGIPFVFGLWISLFAYDQVSPSSPFVGLQNYINLIDPQSIHFGFFWQGLWNTVLFVILSTPTLVGVGLLLAVLLNNRFRGRNFFRGLYFAPWTLSVAVIGVLWWWILQDQGGLISNGLKGIGITPPSWLSSNPWAWISILVATVWWTVGFNTIILLAGIQAISLDLYEAASIDGASRWQQFRSITVPSLRPILLLVVTLQVIASFNLVGQPQLMTGGGPPVNETTPVLLYIYNTGWTGRYELGEAAAMAMVVALIMVVVSVINFRFFASERA
ncbi:MAG: sugar ABC transporter permease [Chloroflexi bacterium]|nr:MAG: sugar ABC transporter permease [Chloroflexota bacterium]